MNVMVGPSMPVDIHHGEQRNRELAKKSWRIERSPSILWNYPGSAEFKVIRGVGVLGGDSRRRDPMWAANGVARHRTRRGSTWVTQGVKDP